ncbi:MAG: patatin-like phospholipase family protein [Myxococcales bacterium]|nr:patatin-like phospholipase family protein [Myxococcales bacterium]
MPTHRDWLAERPFTLALSAGFFGFFAHTGLLAALEAAGLRPRRVIGISAGALAGGLWAAGLEPDDLADELIRLRRSDFWDPSLPLGGLLKGDKFAAKLDDLLSARGVRDFAECRVPFAAIVHDVLRRRPEVVEAGPLAPAIQASCTVPLMFRPRLAPGARLLRPIWVDGGVSDRWGLGALGDGERVLFHALPSRSARSRLVRDQPLPTAGADRRVMVIPGLPRVSPFRLPYGQVALGVAYDYVRRWLELPAIA